MQGGRRQSQNKGRNPTLLRTPFHVVTDDVKSSLSGLSNIFGQTQYFSGAPKRLSSWISLKGREIEKLRTSLSQTSEHLRLNLRTLTERQKKHKFADTFPADKQ